MQIRNLCYLIIIVIISFSISCSDGKNYSLNKKSKINTYSDYNSLPYNESHRNRQENFERNKEFDNYQFELRKLKRELREVNSSIQKMDEDYDKIFQNNNLLDQ